MDLEKFKKAKEIEEQISQYADHKSCLLKSNIHLGGGLIFTYNSMCNDVPLKKELFGDFLKEYMEALDKKIETLKKEFESL